MARPKTTKATKTTRKVRANSLTKKSKSTAIASNSLSEAIGLNYGPFGHMPSQIAMYDTIEKNIRYNLISNNYILLSRMYFLGLCQTLVDTPVDDAFRGGIHIFSKQLDEEQIEKLSAVIDRENDLKAAAQACKWDRLYGGSGLIVSLSDQDPATPLDVSKINQDSTLKFMPCNLWELYFQQGPDGKWNMPASGEGAPLEEAFYNAAGYVNPQFYQYYACKLHASRVLRMIGIEAPSFLRGQLRGWGASIMETIVAPLNTYLKTNDLTFELLDEFKVDVYKLDGLTSAVVSPGGTDQVRRRLEIVNMQKSYQNAIALDKEDDFQSKQGSFAGLADIYRENRINVASALRLPQAKIWGESASGFSSGQDSLEMYAAIVEGQVREKVKWHLHKIVELRCQQLFGMIPEDLKISFDSLRIMTSEQEETVKNAKFSRLLQARERGEITRYEFREGCNKEKLLGISLDLAGDDLNDEDPEAMTLIEQAKAAVVAQDKPEQEGELKIEGEADQEIAINAMTPEQMLEEAQAQKLDNTAQFDRASYLADGGDAWTRGRPKEMFEDYKDKALWEKARQRSKEAYGHEKWEFIAWWYIKHGGKFVA